MVKQTDLVFIAPYPTDNNIQDGYYQRIKNIDNEFTDLSRIYILITRSKFKKKIKKYGNVTFYELNLFLHFFKIWNITKKAKYIYVHSILRYAYFRFFDRTKAKIFLDFHGTVPEESLYKGNKKEYKYYNRIEKRAVSRANAIVFVSDAMRDFVTKKYPSINIVSIYKPIIAKNVINYPPHQIKENIPNNNVVFLYSGGTQKWQNIDKIFEFIKTTIQPNFTYVFLTLDTILIKEKAKENNIPLEQIIIKTVKPEELASYYKIANYGFLIRDDHILNRVANPTKMLEYLYFGIIPIVDLLEIGDYCNYDYIKYTDTQNHFNSKKSEKNSIIANSFLNKEILSIRELLLK